MEIRSIMCCCGQGLGSSMIVSMNVEKALKKLGVSGVKVEHTAIGEVTEGSADLFVIGADLAPQMTSYKKTEKEGCFFHPSFSLQIFDKKQQK